MLTVLPRLLPAELASKVSYNSEGYVLAVLLGLWIQFARRRLSGRTWEWPVTALAAAACLVLGILMYTSDWPSRFKTLNEAFIAAGPILLYVQSRRRPSYRLAITLAVVVLAIIVFFDSGNLVTRLAEGVVMLLLVPIAFDVVDRGILSPAAMTSHRLRYWWYAALVVIPTTLSILGHYERITGPARDVTHYIGRSHEAFVGVLLIELFFAVGLGRTGRSVPAGLGHPSTRDVRAVYDGATLNRLGRSARPSFVAVATRALRPGTYKPRLGRWIVKGG
jgi:hypothetical protein